MRRHQQMISTGVVTAYLFLAGTLVVIYLAGESLEKKRKLPKWMQ